MGFIAELARSKATFEGQGREAVSWDQVFGEPKERPRRTIRGGHNNWTSSISNPEAFKRLLVAMRSRAPGQWTDDRYEQTLRHYKGAVFTAVSCLSRQMSQAEFQIYRKAPDHPDGKVPVEGDHALIKLLERPNNQDSFGKIMYRWSQQMRLTGMALTWMVPNIMGRPYELYSIPTAMAIPQPAISPDFPDGYYRIQPLYPYGPFSSYPTPNSAVGAPIPSQWMLRFLYPHPLLRYEGYSPLTGMNLEIDQLDSMNRSRWYSMKRSINPSGVLNFSEYEGMLPLTESEIERIHAEWESFQGPENHGRLIVGTPGSSLEEFGHLPKDMDYPQGWEQMMSFILGGGFGITKAAAGMSEDASYSNLYATLKQLHLLTLQPDCDDIAADLTHNLAPHFGDDLIIEIRCKRIDDHDIKMAELNMLTQNGAITYNQLLRELERPVTDEPWGNERVGKDQQPGMPGAPGAQMPGMAPPLEGMAPGGEPDPAALQQQGEEILGGLGNPEQQEEREIEGSRPRPGNLGAGALGPRMKRLAVRAKPHSNGHAKKLAHKKKSLSSQAYSLTVQALGRRITLPPE